MIFVDYLSVYQSFIGQDYPFLASEVSTTFCALTGEIKREFTKGYQHLGSFDSTLLIKFDKGILSVSGNPSHWCKADNLWGCQTVQDAMEVYNFVLRSLGYPEFYDCEDTYLTSKPFASQKGYIRDGLQITRVDLTHNYMSDIPALDMLRYLSTSAYRGEAGFLYPNGRTVEWLGTRSGDNGKTSTHIYFKYYDKAWDIEQKLKKCVQQRKRHLVNSLKLDDTIFNSQLLAITETINYLTRLLDYCNQYNVVRFELELKSKKIKELGLCKLGRWSREIMLELVNKYTPHTKAKCQFNKTVDLYSQLIAFEIPERKAGLYSSIGQLWLNGHDVNFKRNLSIKKDTYYRARSALLLLGFDIASPLNIVNFPVQVQTVMLQPLEKPAWYREAA
jgi:II/X family phage/plasmid replication protein